MADNRPHVLLVSTDEGLRTAVSRSRPTHATLQCLSPKEVTRRHLATVSEIWIDLDAGWNLAAPGPDRRVYFHSAPPPPQGSLPSGLFIHKPCAESVFQILWAAAEAETAQSDSRTLPSNGLSLPAWLLDFQELDLKLLCRKCVTALPALLGYRIASLYLHDARHGLLKLADTSHDRPIDPAIPLVATADHLLAAMAQTGRRLHTRDAAVELARRGIPQHADRSYEDSECLIAPLISDSHLWGALAFTGRLLTPPAAENLPLDQIFDFLARALHNACAHEQARIEARVDSLTGLYNQRWMMEALEKEIRRAERFATPLSVLLIDLDGLKAVNDRVGHAAGDCLLRHVAQRIATVLRQFDGAARVGGDEFVVMLPATNLKGARHVAGRLLESIRADAAEFEQQSLPTTASIGVVEWRDGWDSHKLIDAADRAMYCAKSSGRNRMVCEPNPRPTVLRLGTNTPAERRPAVRVAKLTEQPAPPPSFPNPAVSSNPRRKRASAGHAERPARS